MKINQLKGGAALSYLTIFLTNIVGLLLTPFIIRSLGSAEYGLYTMIGALVGYMSVLDFGLNKTIVRFVAKYQAEDDKKGEENFLAHSFIMYLCISLVVAALGCLLYYNIEALYSDTLTSEQIGKAKTMTLVLIFNLAISLPGGAFTGICYGYEEFILPKVTNIIRYIVRSVLVVAILLQGGDSISLVILDTLMNLLVILINAYIAFKLLNVKFKIHFYDKKLFKTTLNFSIWLFVFAIINQLRWQFGQFTIGLFYSTSIVAIYAVGITLGNYYGAFASAISTVFLPKAMQMTVKNIPSAELTKEFIKISRIILLVLLYIFGGFIISGKEFVFFWVGKEYEDAYYYTLVIMIGLTPILSQGFANNILEAKNLMAFRGKLLFILTLLGAIIGFFVVQYFGVMQMICITALFMLLERAIMTPYYNSKANLNMAKYYKAILPLIAGCLAIILMTFFIKSFFVENNFYMFLGKIVIYSILYFLGMHLLMTTYEKKIIQESVFRPIKHLASKIR